MPAGSCANGRLIRSGCGSERIVHDEFGIERLFLVSHGRRLSIAGFLGPDEKASFAGALSEGLGQAERGPTRTVFD